jgi:hypothetical protein
MATANANIFHSAIYFFTPPSQKAPTANPDRPNFFNILSATTSLVKDNLFNDDKGGFKFKTLEDYQVEALMKWDKDKSFEKNNKNNQYYYLGAIKRIKEGDKNFISKCQNDGVDQERIKLLKNYTDSEFLRIAQTVRPSPQRISHQGVKLNRKEPVVSQRDVDQKHYRELLESQRREKAQPFVKKITSTARNARDNAFDVVKKIKSSAEFVGNELSGDGVVFPWRVEKDPKDPNNFSLKPSLTQRSSIFASPASTTYSQRDARKRADDKFRPGYTNTSVNSLLNQARSDKEQLKQLYGSRNGGIMYAQGVEPPRGGRSR